MYLLASFILQNFKKILRADTELWRCAIFWPKMAHLSWTYFLVQTIIITFIYLLAPFIVQKILSADQLWGSKIFWPKMVHFPKWEVFQKTCWWALFLSFMSIYMQKIKSEINLKVNYWRLKNTEISLAERHFWL